MKQYLGIDLGASGFKYGVGDSKHGLQHFANIRIRNKSLEELADIFAQILDDTRNMKIAGIGIGCPGTLHMADAKLVGKNPNLPELTGISVKELLPEHLALPIWVENDANLMALAEASLIDPSVVIGITVGSGIGCGIIQDQQIYHGAHGFAAEPGHCIMVPDGELCSCGQKGCLEAYSSVDGIRRRLQNLNSIYHDLNLPDLIFKRKEVKEIDQVITQGEELLIRALANLITVLDPQTVVLGGGAMELGLYSITHIQQQVLQYIPLAHREIVNIALARYKNQAGIMGAILLCERSAGWE